MPDNGTLENLITENFYFFLSRMYRNKAVSTLTKISPAHSISRKFEVVQSPLRTQPKLPIRETVTLQKVSTVRDGWSYRRYCASSVRQLEQRQWSLAAINMQPLKGDDFRHLIITVAVEVRDSYINDTERYTTLRRKKKRNKLSTRELQKKRTSSRGELSLRRNTSRECENLIYIWDQAEASGIRW